MKTRAAWVAILLLGALGCGLKGPLYLPDHAGAVVTRPAAAAQNTSPTQQAGAASQPAASSGTGPAASATPGGTAPAGAPNAAGTGRDGTVVHKNPGKDDDPAQK